MLQFVAKEESSETCFSKSWFILKVINFTFRVSGFSKSQHLNSWYKSLFSRIISFDYGSFISKKEFRSCIIESAPWLLSDKVLLLFLHDLCQILCFFYWLQMTNLLQTFHKIVAKLSFVPDHNRHLSSQEISKYAALEHMFCDSEIQSILCKIHHNFRAWSKSSCCCISSFISILLQCICVLLNLFS